MQDAKYVTRSRGRRLVHEQRTVIDRTGDGVRPMRVAAGYGALIMVVAFASLAAAPPPLPQHAVERLGTTDFRAPGKITALEYHPHGKTLAATDQSGCITVWDSETGERMNVLPSGEATSWQDLIYSHDGDRLFVVGRALKPQSREDAGAVDLLDPQANAIEGLLAAYRTGQELKPLWRAGPYEGLAPEAIATDPAGRYVAMLVRDLDTPDAGRSERRSRVIVFDAETGAVVREIDYPARYPHSLQFSPDGDLIVAAGADDGLRAWKSQTGEPAWRQHRDEVSIESLHHGSESDRFAAVTITGRLPAFVLINPEDGEVVTRVGLRRKPIGSARAVSRDGRVVCLPTVGDLVVFDLGGVMPEREFRAWGAAVRYAAAAIRPDRRELAVATGSAVFRWNLREGKPIPEPAPVMGLRQLGWSKDGQVVHGYNGRHWQFDRKTGESQGSPTIATPSAEAAMAMDGSLIAISDFDGVANIRDSQTGDELDIIIGPEGEVPGGVALSREGRWIAMQAGYPDEPGSLGVYNVHTHEELWRIDDLPRLARPAVLAFSPTNRWLAAALPNGAVQVRQARNGQGLRVMRKPWRELKDQVAARDQLSFSLDGARLAVFANDMRVYTMIGGVEPVTIPLEHRPTAIALSPDGSRLATSFKERITLWDTTTAKPVTELTGHQRDITALIFLPDGKLLSASDDTTCLLWKVPKGE